MPVEISVGAPLLTINQGNTFMVTDLNGQIAADSDLGVFADDTRFVSYYEISADGNAWRRLSSAATTHYTSRAYLICDAFETEAGAIPSGTVGLIISRTIDDGIHEDLDITNFGRTLVKFNLEVALRSDFADIFEVKSHRFVRRGRIATEWDQKGHTLRTSYANRDFERVFTYSLSDSGSPPVYANGRITFPILLESRASWHSCCEYTFGAQRRMRRPLRRCYRLPGNTRIEEKQRQWMAQATSLTSANEDVYRLFRQSVEDIGALRLHDHDYAPDVWIPAAGVPWFVAIFGRDSLIVSLQNMLVFPGFARGALKKLAELQATERDDWRDAEPGKIPHELRRGELAHLHKIPHTPYYGTADATGDRRRAMKTWAGKDAGDAVVLIGIQADAPSNRLYVDPELPSWLPDVTLHGVRVGEAKFDLKFFREGEHTRWDADVLTGRIEVQVRAWQPWSISASAQPSNA